MKRLSISLPALALAAMLFFVSTANANPRPSFCLPPQSFFHSNTPYLPFPTLSSVPSTQAHYDYIYYWYTYPNDTYVDYQTMATEEWEWMWWLGGVLVDDSPMGGTLILKGYLYNYYPHIDFPDAYLYTH